MLYYIHSKELATTNETHNGKLKRSIRNGIRTGDGAQKRKEKIKKDLTFIATFVIITL